MMVLKTQKVEEKTAWVEKYPEKAALELIRLGRREKEIEIGILLSLSSELMHLDCYPDIKDVLADMKTKIEGNEE